MVESSPSGVVWKRGDRGAIFGGVFQSLALASG
jgi:hypothetical protein